MNQKIIDRFYKGECTAEEVKAVMEWIHSEASADFFSDKMKKLWEQENPDSSKRSPRTRQIAQKSLDLIFRPKAPSRNIPYNPRRTSFWKIASVILLLIVAGVSYQLLKKPPSRQLTETNDISTIIKQNPKGQKSKIFLPDGSVVWLNAESTITYADGFQDGTRHIRLLGEAFFEVIRNEQVPFVVEAGNTETSVLGTKFNVHAYPDEETTTIALVEGKVIVGLDAHYDDSVVELKPGEALRANNSTSKVSKFEFNPSEHTLWKDGLLHFQQNDLDQVISKIERWYGVNITVKNHSDLDWSYTGEFQNEYLENVLMAMSFTRDFNYEIHNKEVILNFK